MKTQPSSMKMGKDQDKDKAKATGRNRHSNSQSTIERPKCLFCGRTGHNIIDCLKLLAAQAAAKADSVLDKKKAIVEFNTSTLDYYDDEDSTYLSSHVAHIRPSAATTQSTIVPIFVLLAHSTTR